MALTTTWYTFDSQFLQKDDGVTMENLASVATAEMYLQGHKETAICMALNLPLV